MPINHIRGHIGRMLVAAGGGIYLRLLAIPWMRFHGLLGTPNAIRLAHGAAIVSDRNRICKVALWSKSAIAREHRNCSLARSKWPQLGTILPEVEAHEGMFASCLSMARYRPLEAEDSIRHATAIYGLMQTCRIPDARSIRIEESTELSSGIEFIADLYGGATGNVVREHVQSYLGSADYHLGFAHGDFHSRNILLDAHGAPRLVDLDCVRFNGIQELDAMNFAIEREWSRSGQLWYRTIFDFMRGTPSGDCLDILGRFGVSPSFGLLVTYLMDRIGQETRNFGFSHTRTNLDPAVDAIQAARQAGIKEGP